MPETLPCTVEQVAAFNRALYPLVLQACETSGVPPTHVVLYADFVMTDGAVLSAMLGPPEPETGDPHA